MKLEWSASLCKNVRMKKYRHPYTASALTLRRMAGLMMALSVIAMVVGAYCMPVLSVSDLVLWLVARLRYRVWDVLCLLSAVPLPAALWQYRQRRSGGNADPLLSSVMLCWVPAASILLLLFLSGFWVICSTPAFPCR